MSLLDYGIPLFCLQTRSDQDDPETLCNDYNALRFETMDKIIDGLYIGSIRDSKNPELLTAHSITHILSIHDTAKCGQIQGIKYLCIRIADSPHQNIIKYISKCNDFIHKARVSGGNVLIHCLAGISRSVTIAAAYLITVTTLNPDEALDAIRTVRSISSPNPGFYKQLLNFQMYGLKSEQNRLGSKPNADWKSNDDIQLRQLLKQSSIKPKNRSKRKNAR